MTGEEIVDRLANPSSISALDGDMCIGLHRRHDEPIAVLGGEGTCDTRRSLARYNLRLQRRLEVEGQPLVLHLARRGAGFALLPFCAIAADLAAGRLSGAPIEGLTITWTLGVNRLRAHDPAVRELIQLIHEAIDSRIASGDWRVAPAQPSSR